MNVVENKIYTVEWTPRANKHLLKLDRKLRDEIAHKVKTYLVLDPRGLGKRVAEGIWKGSWKYRVRDYRVFYDIYEEEVKIAVFRVKNRKDRDAYDE
ncbi:MAG: hypothetical protein AM1032_000007 [Mycoplasmataceae bacterium]|nr:MAG: hypothetical protein AM1032_000007 [Mycoplasmataceae bacterium]